jgi:hypothetical protein
MDNGDDDRLIDWNSFAGSIVILGFACFYLYINSGGLLDRWIRNLPFPKKEPPPKTQVRPKSEPQPDPSLTEEPVAEEPEIQESPDPHSPLDPSDYREPFPENVQTDSPARRSENSSSIVCPKDAFIKSIDVHPETMGGRMLQGIRNYHSRNSEADRDFISPETYASDPQKWDRLGCVRQ